MHMRKYLDTAYFLISKFKMKSLILIFLAFGSAAQSESITPHAWDDPHAKFNAKNTITNQTIVTWKRVDNVIDECNTEFERLGFAKILYRVQACSFWTKTSCTIITSKTTTQHSLGHELRHCFQGNWHK